MGEKKMSEGDFFTKNCPREVKWVSKAVQGGVKLTKNCPRGVKLADKTSKGSKI